MAEKFIRIVNWEHFQHYKDRNPPWIKLHRGLMQSQTWVMGDDASRTLAIACMLLAAATDNRIPADPVYLQRVAYLNSAPDLSQLLRTQFIEIIDENENASTLLATCKQEASVSLDRGEKRREEAEAEKRRGKKRSGARAPSPAPRKRAEQLPKGFKPKESHRRLAGELGIDLSQAFEKFCDHHIAKGSTFKDWDRALNTWLRNERDFRGRKGNSGNRAQQRQADNLAALNAAFPLDR